MPRYSKPVWQMVREAIEELRELDARSVTDWIDSHYPEDRVNRGTIQAQLIACSLNHPSAHHFQDSNRFLFYLGKGRYRLHEPATDGLWKLTTGGPIRVEQNERGEVPFARVEAGNRITLPADIVQKLELRPNDVVAFVDDAGKIVVRKARLKLEVT